MWAHEDQRGTTDSWYLEAYAMCADPIDGMHIAMGLGTAISVSVQSPQAHCNPGEKVLATGGWITETGEQVGFQVVCASVTYQGLWS